MQTVVSEKQRLFATEPIGKLIIKFAVPSVIALLVNSLYNIVDQILSVTALDIWVMEPLILCFQLPLSHWH